MYQKLRYFLSATVLVFLLSQCMISWHKNIEQMPPPPPTGRKATVQRCYKNGHLTVAERSGRYPFSEAAKVVFMAFDEASGKIPVANGPFDSAQIKSIKVLDNKQLNTLTDLIFNYNYSTKNQLRVHTEPGCYIPRNAILFIEEQERVFAYLEICFECYQYKSSEEQVNLGAACEDKLNLLKKLFNDAGVTTTFVPYNELAPDPVLKPLPGKQE